MGSKVHTSQLFPLDEVKETKTHVKHFLYIISASDADLVKFYDLTKTTAN